ncbi:hypothetical protein ACFL35_21250 [Candidatus Riflebacteria bacterium]
MNNKAIFSLLCYFFCATFFVHGNSSNQEQKSVAAKQEKQKEPYWRKDINSVLKNISDFKKKIKKQEKYLRRHPRNRSAIERKKELEKELYIERDYLRRLVKKVEQFSEQGSKPGSTNKEGLKNKLGQARLGVYRLQEALKKNPRDKKAKKLLKKTEGDIISLNRKLGRAKVEERHGPARNYSIAELKNFLNQTREELKVQKGILYRKPWHRPTIEKKEELESLILDIQRSIKKKK